MANGNYGWAGVFFELPIARRANGLTTVARLLAAGEALSNGPLHGGGSENNQPAAGLVDFDAGRTSVGLLACAARHVLLQGENECLTVGELRSEFEGHLVEL